MKIGTMEIPIIARTPSGDIEIGTLRVDMQAQATGATINVAPGDIDERAVMDQIVKTLGAA